MEISSFNLWTLIYLTSFLIAKAITMPIYQVDNFDLTLK